MFEMFFHLAGDEDVTEVYKTTFKAAGDFIHKTWEVWAFLSTKGNWVNSKRLKHAVTAILGMSSAIGI